MSNTIKALIAIVSIIILGSGIFVLTKSRTVENIPNTSISSVSQMISSSSLKVVVSSVSKIAFNMPQITSKVDELPIISKTEQSKSGVSLPKTDTVDGVEVVYLDSKNPPQYIKDYMVCGTKLKLGNIFLQEGSETKFYCPPSATCENPKYGYRFNYDNKSWSCEAGRGEYRGCLFGIETFLKDETTKEQILTKINSEESTLGLERCYFVINRPFTQSEINSLQTIFPNTKLIIFVQK